MRTTIPRILSVILAGFLLLGCLASFAACGKKKPIGIPAPSPLSPGSKDNTATVSSYVEENLSLLEEIVRYITAREGLSYYYFNRAGDNSIYIERLTQTGRERIQDKTLEKLAATGFTGELTYSDDTALKGIVSFYTYISLDNVSRSFVYCPDEAAVAYLRDGFFRGAEDVNTVKINEHWYFVEAK